jgi:hypothetical protein
VPVGVRDSYLELVDFSCGIEYVRAFSTGVVIFMQVLLIRIRNFEQDPDADPENNHSGSGQLRI